MKKNYLQIVQWMCAVSCMCSLATPIRAIPLNAESIEKTTLDHQKKNISGRIIDKNGNPLIGVAVVQKGTNNGTVTDTDGKYKLTLVGNDQNDVVFSYIGYRTIEIQASQVSAELVMEEDAIAVDELVVVGYAVQRKKDLTGATSSLKASETKIPVITSLDQMMQGNLSGVNITNASGMSSMGFQFPIPIMPESTIASGAVYKILYQCLIQAI